MMRIAGVAASLLLMSVPVSAGEMSSRLGRNGRIISTHAGARHQSVTASQGEVPYPYPRPRVAGFSPYVAVVTSDAADLSGDEYEHNVSSIYVGNPINPPASQNYIFGIADSGADVNLVGATAAETLGLTGEYLTSNTVEIGGVSEETVLGIVTWPVGYFAAGLSEIDANGSLNVNAVRGHWNVSGVVAPPIICDDVDVISALLGTAFLSFHNMVIRVDAPHRIHHGDQTVFGPDVTIQSKFAPLPDYEHWVGLELGGEIPLATTASYWPNLLDLDADPEMPWIPTRLSIVAGFQPTGGWYFTQILVLEGEPGPTNVVQPMRVLVDTGSQSSIMSSTMAASLSLPFEPDFTVDICGVGGVTTDVPGYYIDYVKINAAGGALEYSRAPFIVLDVASPEGGILDGILGMNFFWDRNITFEPSIDPSTPGYLTVSDPVPFAAGDFDLDLHVDNRDASTYVACYTGPGDDPLSPDCEHTDVDLNGSIDLADFCWIQRCFSGSEVSADTSCGP